MLRLVCISLLLPLSLWGQETVGVGQWRSYLSHKQLHATAIRGNICYAMSDVGVVYYDTELEEYRELSRINGLASAQPTALHHAQDADYLVVGYADGLLDYWRQPEQIAQISDLHISSTVSAKGIRAMVNAGPLLYVAFDAGLWVVDLERRETRTTVLQFGNAPSQQPVQHVALCNDSIWVLSTGQLYAADARAANLADPSSWVLQNGTRGLPATGLQFLTGVGIMHLAANDGIYDYSQRGWQPFLGDNPALGVLTGLQAGYGWLAFQRGQTTRIFAVDMQSVSIVSTQPVAASHNLAVVQGGLNHVMAVADAEEGLLVYAGDSPPKQIFARSSALPSNRMRAVAAADGRLFVAPTGYVGRFQPGFSTIGYYTYDKANDTWRTFSQGNGKLGTVYFDFGDVVLDRGVGTAYLASWMHGIVATTLSDVQYVLDSNTANLPGQLPTSTGKPSIIYISSVDVDAQANVWACSFDAARPLFVRRPDGSTINYSLGGNNRPLQLLACKQSTQKWMALADQNLLVYDDGGNPTSTAGHRLRVLRPGLGQGGLPGAEVLALAEDADGLIWVGTGRGVGVFNRPSRVFENTVQGDAECPVVNGRCLLQDERVQCIAVDAENRKWMGTTNGVFLVTADGTAVLQHFTTANSPLPSNNVRDLALDPQNGELFVATDLGLVSYRGTATEALDNTHLQVFPNPAYNDFATAVALRGLAARSTIRITTISGQLVRTLVSEAGQVLWDGRNAQGQLVSSGVYLALVADSKGQQTGVAKIVVLERQ